MTIVTFPRHRRRIVAICVATVALHFVTINWVSGRIGAAERDRDADKDVIKADLRLAPPPTPAPEVKPAEPPPKPKPRKVPKPPKPAAPPPEPVDAVAEPGPAAPAEPAPADGTDAAPATVADAAPAPAAVESPQPAPAAPAQADAQARWKVALPPSARFDLDVKRKDADGTNWSGSANIAWQQDGASYKVMHEVGVKIVFARINLLQQGSEGTINEFGIAPAKFDEKRRNRSATATHFNQQEQKITFSASERTIPLTAGAQDRATVLFQLAAIGRADVNQYGKDIDILVGDDRDAQVYRFQLIGEEELETDMGKLVTWHLARMPKPGSYNTRLDIWLAPSQEWYPVQIRSTERNGAVTTETVTRITK